MRKRCVLLGLIILFAGHTALFASGGTESTEDEVTLQLFFFSPELQEQYNDMVEVYKEETGVNLELTVLQTDYNAV